MTTTTTTDPAYVDPALINPRAVRLVNAFKDFLARMRDEEGLTYQDFSVAADLLQRAQQNTGAPLAMIFGPLYSEVFVDDRDGYTPAAGVDAFTVIHDTPHIGNPGTLPMRPDEPGTPLFASGRVLDGHGRPIQGAKLEIFHAADNGNYSGLYDDGVPKYNLRGHLFTDAEGRYAFTTVTPSSYADPHVTAVDGVAEACAALGRSLYRPAHIHYEVHHPDLITPWAGEIYFKGDPVIPVDFVGGTKAPPSLQADTVLHEDPKDIAAAGLQGPYRTTEFDFVLKTRTSPDTIALKETAA